MKKIKAREKKLFIGTLADLLENGFTFFEAIQVMQRSERFDADKITQFKQVLARGDGFIKAFEQVGFSAQETAQIQLAERHGNLIGTLKTIEKQIAIRMKQKQELRKVLSYPLVLLVFMTTMLFSMRQILLPQLLATGMIDETHFGVRMIRDGPLVLSGLLTAFVLLFLGSEKYYQQQSAIQKARMMARIPIFNKFYRLYLTMYFAMEWGKLFQEGLEMREIIQVMQLTTKHSLMNELAQDLQSALLQGQDLSDKIKSYSFFTPEFSQIVFQGAIKGQLGPELLIYSQLSQTELQRKIEGLIQWIQPAIFVLIALLIVSVYGSLFLPLYGNLEQIR